MIRPAFLLVLVFTSLVTIHGAPLPRRMKIGDYVQLQRVTAAAVSPDGLRFVYQVGRINLKTDRFESSLWLMNVDGTANIELGKGSGAIWSPDSRRIAYTADAHGNTQIFIRDATANSQSVQITKGVLWPANLQWSPDGQSIGFAGWVEQPKEWPIELPEAPPGAKWAERPHIIDTLHYRTDGAGFVDGGRTHLFVVPAGGGEPRQITSGEWSVGFWWDGLQSVNWSWTPDSKSIVFDALATSDSDTNYADCGIHAIDVASRRMRTLTPQRGLWNSPAVSPDGEWVAFVGFPEIHESYQSQELYVVPFGGGTPRKISGNLDRDVSELHWAADSQSVYFTAQDRGSQNIYVASLDGHVRAITRGSQVFSLTEVTRSGVVIAQRTSLDRPAEIVAFPIDAPQRVAQLTHLNDDFLRSIALTSVSEIHYPASDGADIQGWLYQPAGFTPTKSYPLILFIHGGPVIMCDTRFSFRLQYYASNGYFVLMVNPRSSSGYGTEWTNAVSYNMPGLDYDDLMGGVDFAIRTQPAIDAKRLFVTGGSYGGTLTAWTVGHTSRFSAAVVESPNIDWISWSGTSDLPLSAGNFFFRKPFWEDPAEWLAHSPLMYAGHVQTPTLIISGESDYRTPIGQAEEFYVALKTRGVTTRFLRFPADSHLGISPSHVMRRMQYVLSWMHQYDPKAVA